MTKEKDLIVKDVDFRGQKLKSVQNKETQKIYVGASWVCSGIGLSKSQKDTQIQNIQSDEVLKRGCLKFQAGVFDSNNETVALDIEFLPLWLAKISITPKMKRDNPTTVSRLVDYQLKAKDVLAKAFIYGEFDLPMDYKSALSQLMLMFDKNNQLQNENISLQNTKDLYNKFLDSKGFVSMNKAAKGLKVGRNKMMEFLRTLSVLFKDDNDNIPYQQYVTLGYFTVDYHNGRDGRLHAVTKVSSRGIVFIHKLYEKHASLLKGSVA